MKSETLVFIGEDGQAARAFAASIRDGSNRVLLCAADSFSGVADPRAETVHIMPDVIGWHRERIVKAYGEKVHVRRDQPQPDLSAWAAEHMSDEHSPSRTVQHRGFGRWYVMHGDEVVSGPHTKDEAEALA